MNIEKELTNIKIVMIKDLDNWIKKPNMNANLVMINTASKISSLQKRVRSKKIKDFLEVFKESIVRNVFTKPKQVTSQWINFERKIKEYLRESKTTVAA